MATLTPQLPTVAVPITPTYTAVTAADKFAANPGTTYMISYVNGATAGTLQLYVTDQYTTVPPGSATPAVPANGTNWSDALISAALGANASRIIVLDKSIIGNFIDSTGFVNLKHNGTLTTITVAILGPF
jgi:hypothetical protein